MRENGFDVDHIGEYFHMDGARVGGDVERNCSIFWLFNKDLLHCVRIGTVINGSEEFMGRQVGFCPFWWLFV